MCAGYFWATGAVVQPRVGIVDWLVQYGSSPAADAYGDFTDFYASPNAPTLTSPANASYQDVASGITFQATYNSADGTNQNAFAFRVKTSSGSYLYWNAGTSALQSTIVWNTDSVSPSGSFSITLPSGAISDGNVYNWSFASQSASGGNNYQGPFATDFTFTAQAPPSVVVDSPTGTVGGTTQPAVTWTPSVASGASQTAYQVIIESGYSSGATAPGTGTTAWSSGVVTGSATAVTVGTPLVTGTTYRAWVQITETGGQTSNWGYSPFTLSVDVPATPIITATPGTDPDTGCPLIALSIQGQDNYLDAADSSFESGIGTAVGTNCSVAQSDAEALDGAYSLLLTAASAGNMSVKLGPYAVTAGEKVVAFAAFRAASTARTCTVGLSWTGASGTPTSSGYSDSSSAWTQSSESSAPPSGLIISATAPTGATELYVACTVESAANSEEHYVDCVAVKPYVSGVTPTWSIGGFVGLTSCIITRSDNVYVYNASLANPLTIPSSGQLATVSDYTPVPQVSYTYSAVVQVTSPTQLTSTAATSSSESVTTTKWWEVNPLNPSTAVAAQMISWTPTQTEQSSANQVMNQATMNIAASAMMAQDMSATAWMADNATYEAFNALLTSQQTVFVSSPWGALDSGYFRFGPSSGGMSSGIGNPAKNTTLKPSSAAAGVREVTVTAVAQQRPAA